MPRSGQVQWTVPMKNRLVACYVIAKGLKNGNSLAANVEAEFSKFYPECVMKQKTLYCYAHKFEKEIRSASICANTTGASKTSSDDGRIQGQAVNDKRLPIYKPSSPLTGRSADKTALLIDTFSKIKAIPLTLEPKKYALQVIRLCNSAGTLQFLKEVRRVKPIYGNLGMAEYYFDSSIVYEGMLRNTRVIATSGGGHCLFNAACIGLFGNETNHFHLRMATCRMFAENWQHFESMQLMYGFEGNVHRLIHNTCRFDEELPQNHQIGWGANAHLKAIAMIAERELFVFLPLSVNDRKQRNVPDYEVQPAIDGGSTQNVRYFPLQHREDNVVPLIVLLSADHYSAVVMKTANSRIFVQLGRGDVQLFETVSDIVTVESATETDEEQSIAVCPQKVVASRSSAGAFVWDKEKEEQLLRCLAAARTNTKGAKKIEIRLQQAFITLYPLCTIKPRTLYARAVELHSGKSKTLLSKVKQTCSWHNQMEMDLIECAKEAHVKNQELIFCGDLEGKCGPKSAFHNILSELFRKQYHEVCDDAVKNKFIKLKAKFNLQFEEIPHTATSEEFASIMRMWEYGFKLSTTPLYQGCCYICSSLIVRRGMYQKTAIDKDPVEVPVLGCYPAAYLDNMFKKRDKNEYYKCTICKSNNLLLEYPLAPEDVEILPLPPVLESLNSLEKAQVALVGLHSKTERKKDSQHGVFEHRRGEMYAYHKNNQRYFDMYAMIIEKMGIAPTATKGKILAALKWLRLNNPLYREFYANYETLFRYAKPKQGDPKAIMIFDKKGIEPVGRYETADTILEEENAALVIPQYDVEARGSTAVAETVTATQHTRVMQQTRDLLYVKYSDRHLAEKIFPWLHPYGIGGFKFYSSLTMGKYLQWRLTMADNRFRTEVNYAFYFLDMLLKRRIQLCNRVKVSVGKLQELPTRKEFDMENIYESKYGLEVPTTIPNSKNYWYVKTQELLALSAFKQRQPDFFITLTQNDNWPEMQAIVRDGMRGKAEAESKYDLELTFGERDAVNYPVEMVEVFYRRLQAFKDRVLCNKSNILGEVEDYWLRIEYQNRGGLHAHLVVWCVEGSVPENVISAEMPRYLKHSRNDNWRDYVKMLQNHACFPRCFKVGKNKTTKSCKYGFPYKVCHAEGIAENGMRYIYKRAHAEDIHITPYNLALLMFWGAHLNVQKVTNGGWEMYLGKYVAKSATSVKIKITDASDKTNEACRQSDKAEDPKRATAAEKREETGDVEKFLTTRLVSSIECCAILLQKFHSFSSRNMIYLPIEVDPQVRVVRRKQHMKVGTNADSTDIYYQSKLEKYLDRPDQLGDLTYPEFYANYYYPSNRLQRPEHALIDEDDRQSDDEDGPPITSDGRLTDKEGRVLFRRINKEAVPYFTLALAEYARRVREVTDDIGTAAFLNEARQVNPVYYNAGSMRPYNFDRTIVYEGLLENGCVVSTNGGGHCMFNAACIGLFGVEQPHYRLRAAVCDTFARYHDHFQSLQLVYGFTTVQQLIRDTCRFRNEALHNQQIGWGSNAHLKAIAIIAERSVFVYLPLSRGDRAKQSVPEHEVQAAMDAGSTQNLRYSPLRQREDNNVPLMVLLMGQHYSAILSKNDNCRVFVPSGQGDVPLDELVPNLATVEPGAYIDMNDEDEAVSCSATSKSTSCTSLRASAKSISSVEEPAISKKRGDDGPTTRSKSRRDVTSNAIATKSQTTPSGRKRKKRDTSSTFSAGSKSSRK